MGKTIRAFILALFLSVLVPVLAYADLDYSVQEHGAGKAVIELSVSEGTAEFRYRKGHWDEGGFAAASVVGNGSSASVTVAENGQYTLYALQGNDLFVSCMAVVELDQTPPDIKLLKVKQNADGTADVAYEVSDYHGISGTWILQGSHPASDYGMGDAIDGGVIHGLSPGTYTIFAMDESGNVSVHILNVDFSDYYEEETQREVDSSEDSDSYEYGSKRVMVEGDPVTCVSISKCDLVTGAELKDAILQIQDESGTVIKEWVTTGTKTIIENVLKPGHQYILTEITAPEGYEVSESVPFYVKEDGSLTKVIMYDERIKNEDPKQELPARVIISKCDLVNGSEVAGATLQIFDETGQKIYEWVTNGVKTVIDGKLIPGKTYTLTERQAPDGYEIAESISFTVKEDGSITEVIMYDRPKVPDTPKPDNGGDNPSHPSGPSDSGPSGPGPSGPGPSKSSGHVEQPAASKVLISKCDLVDGHEISGAKLQIKDEAGDLVKEWVTNGTRTLIENDLKAGKTYTLTEIMAPKGYEVAESVTFSVKEDGSITTVTMYDRPRAEKPGTGPVRERLPQTGGMDAGMAAWITALSSLMVGITGFILVSWIRKK